MSHILLHCDHCDSTNKYSDYIAHLDGSTEIDGGWINHNYIQLGYQLADSVSGLAYSFVGSCIILFLINLVPGLGLRAPEENEVMGIDDAEIGEFAVRPYPLSNLSFANRCSMTTSKSPAT